LGQPLLDRGTDGLGLGERHCALEPGGYVIRDADVGAEGRDGSLFDPRSNDEDPYFIVDIDSLGFRRVGD
jgi:hypothetical protein